MKKTIVYFHQSADLYGSDKTLLFLVKNLNKTLYKPIVVIPKKGLLYEELIQSQINVIVTPVLNIHKKMFTLGKLLKLPFSLYQSIKKLNKELKNEDIYLIQSNSIVVMLGFIYAKMKKIKHLWHIHEVVEKPKIVAYYFHFLVTKFSDVIVSNSQATQQSILATFPKSKPKHIVIYNGLDEKINTTNNNIKETLAINKHAIIISLVGRINHNKGHLQTLKAIKNITKEHQNIQILFVGHYSEGKKYILDNLKNEIEKLDLQDFIKIISFYKNISEIWSITDIAIVPSTIKESFGLTALEAMLAKKPVITSGLGALKEVVTHNITGLIFNNQEEYESHLKELITHKNLRKTLGINGYKKAKEAFTLHNYISSFEKIYESKF